MDGIFIPASEKPAHKATTHRKRKECLAASYLCSVCELDHVVPGQDHLAADNRCADEVIDDILLDIGTGPGHGIDCEDRLVSADECRGGSVEDRAIRLRADDNYALDPL